MEPSGPKIGEGRDSEIFEHGPGRVLKRTKFGTSMEREAETMRYVRSQGYPCPEVFDAGQGYLVMERLDGVTMMDAAGKPPFPIMRSGRLLAELHRRLHEIPAPPDMPVAPLAGDRLVHRDLHPLNVMMTADGPVVIDWANASAGDPAFDVADAWVLFACAAAPRKGIDRVIVPIGRTLMRQAFLGGVDRAAARRAIPAAVEARLADKNMSPAERERMTRFADWAVNG